MYSVDPRLKQFCPLQFWLYALDNDYIWGKNLPKAEEFKYSTINFGS